MKKSKANAKSRIRLQVIVAMGGVGQRFVDKGYQVPKPLIEVEGKPVVQHIVERFPGETDFLFICNSEHLRTTRMREILQSIAPNGTIAEIPPHKLGPVSTILQAENLVKDNSAIVVNHCDFSWEWDYGAFKRLLERTGCAGCIPGYIGFHPSLLKDALYAGVRHDKKGRVIEIREKHRFTKSPMGTFQSSGTYHFKTGKLMKKYLKEAIRTPELSHKGEFYVSSVYSLLLRDNLDIRIFELSKFCQWGTPEDLEEYLVWSNAFRDGTAKELAKGGPVEKKIYRYWKPFFEKRGLIG